MKKIYLTLAFLVAITLTSCGQSEDQNKESEASIETNQSEAQTKNEKDDDLFEQEDGKLVSLDKEADKLDDPALKTILDKDSKTVEIYPADENGEVGSDYYKFDIENNTYEKYKYVSAMGEGFYYTGDLDTCELEKIENKDHDDVTESVKEAGRYDKAAEKTKSEIKDLKSYFEARYNMTMQGALDK